MLLAAMIPKVVQALVPLVPNVTGANREMRFNRFKSVTNQRQAGTVGEFCALYVRDC